MPTYEIGGYWGGGNWSSNLIDAPSMAEAKGIWLSTHEDGDVRSMKEYVAGNLVSEEMPTVPSIDTTVATLPDPGSVEQPAETAGGPLEWIGTVADFIAGQVKDAADSILNGPDLTGPGGDDVAAVTDPYNLYGGSSSDLEVLEAGAGTAVVGVVRLAPFLAKMAGPVAKAILAAVRAVAVNGRAQWSRLPAWVKAALVVVGVDQGVDLLVDEGPGDIGLFGGGNEIGIPGVQVVGTWNANGTKFYRLSDGRIAVQNKRGRWKIWRPKKPIVIFAGGAGNLRTAVRADKALDKQARSLRKMMDRRAPRRQQSRCGTCNFVRCRCK